MSVEFQIKCLLGVFHVMVPADNNHYSLVQNFRLGWYLRAIPGHVHCVGPQAQVPFNYIGPCYGLDHHLCSVAWHQGRSDLSDFCCLCRSHAPCSEICTLSHGLIPGTRMHVCTDPCVFFLTLQCHVGGTSGHRGESTLQASTRQSLKGAGYCFHELINLLRVINYTRAHNSSPQSTYL